MKKLLSLITGVTMLFTLTSCRGGPSPRDLIKANSEPVNQLVAQTEMKLGITQEYDGDVYTTDLTSCGQIEYDEDTIYVDSTFDFEMNSFSFSTYFELYADTANNMMYEHDKEDDIWYASSYNETVVDLGTIDFSKIKPEIFSTLSAEKQEGAYVVLGVTTVDDIIDLIDENATFISIIEDLRDLEVTIVMTFDENTYKLSSVEIFCSDDVLNEYESEGVKVTAFRVYMKVISYETSLEIPREVTEIKEDEDGNTNVIEESPDDWYIVSESYNEERKYDIDILAFVVDGAVLELPMGVQTYLNTSKSDFPDIDGITLSGDEETSVVSSDGSIVLEIFNHTTSDRNAAECKLFSISIHNYPDGVEHTFDFFDVTESSSLDEILAVFGEPRAFCEYSNGNKYVEFSSNIGEICFTLINEKVTHFSVFCTRK